MSLLVKKQTRRKPASWRQPDLSHSTLENCICWLPLLNSAGNYLHDAYGLILDNADLRTADWGVNARGDLGIEIENFGDAIYWPQSLDAWGNLTAGEFSLYVEMFVRGYGQSNAARILQHSTSTFGNMAITYNATLPGIDYYRTNTIGASGGQLEEWPIPGFSVDNKLHKWFFAQRDGDGSHLCFKQDDDAIETSKITRYLGGPSGAKPLVFLNRSTFNRTHNATLLQVRLFDKYLEDSQIESLFDDPWGAFERRIWVPVESGEPGPVALDIESLRHTHALDEPALSTSYILSIDNLRHGHRLDECDVQISDAINLLIDSLRHGHPIDTVHMTSEWTLTPESLRHAHPMDEAGVYWRIDLSVANLDHAHGLDAVDVEAAPEIVIDIQSLSHGHALDSPLIEYETTLDVDSMRHGHRADTVDVSVLMGLLTALEANSSGWRIDAGASLQNPNGADLSWHVLDAVFDGNASILGVDGARVMGNAGVRDLIVLTVGAAGDGSNGVTGEIAELRVYNGTLTQAQRDEIVAELQAKWL